MVGPCVRVCLLLRVYRIMYSKLYIVRGKRGGDRVTRCVAVSVVVAVVVYVRLLCLCPVCVCFCMGRGLGVQSKFVGVFCVWSCVFSVLRCLL